MRMDVQVKVGDIRQLILINLNLWVTQRRPAANNSLAHSQSHTYSLYHSSLPSLSPPLSRLCTTTHDLPLPLLSPFSFQNSSSRSNSPLIPCLPLHSFSPLRFLCTFSSSIVIKVRFLPSRPPNTLLIPPSIPDMDCWRVAVLGDGGVGKTALAVQVRIPPIVPSLPDLCLFPVHPQLLRW